MSEHNGILPLAKDGWSITHIPSNEFDPATGHLLSWISGGGKVAVFHGELDERVHITWGNVFVTSKRIRRALQETTAWTMKAPRKVKFVEATPAWDGCCQMSRQYLMSMTVSANDVQQADVLHGQLKHSNRVEITMLTPDGEYKGHALICDRDDMGGYDLVIAKDPKAGITFDGWYTSIKFVHAEASGYIFVDLQSMINLPIFKREAIAAYAREYTDAIISNIRSGDIVKAYPNIKPSQVNQWPALLALFCGARPMWMPHLVNSIGGSWVKHLQSMNDRLRFPVKGYAAYLVSDEVYGKALFPGECILDLARESCVVSSNEYEQIAKILGGADQDDRLWCVNTTNGLLIWRSPNQQGEYYLLPYTTIVRHDDASCDMMPHDVTSDDMVEIVWNKMPMRIDNQMNEYLDLIHDDTPICMAGEYDPKVMRRALMAELRNKGVLGTVVNYLMITTLLYGEATSNQPTFPLEKIIDATVKNGNDLSLIKAEVKHRFELLEDIPVVMADRVHDDKPRNAITTFLDTLQIDGAANIEYLIGEIEALQFECKPPAALILHGEQYAEVGQKYLQGYGTALGTNGVDAARNYCEEFLASEDNALNVLSGAMYYAFTNQYENHIADAALWISGQKLEVGRAQGIGHLFVQLMQNLQLLAEPVIHEGRVLWYHQPDPPTLASVKINGVWFNVGLNRGMEYESMTDVPKEVRTLLKSDVALACKLRQDEYSKVMRGLIGRTLRIVSDGLRLIITNDAGLKLGTVAKEHEVLCENITELVIQCANARDGNVAAIVWSN